MKQLFFSEWQRMWKRKSTWLCFGLVPIILFNFVKYYLKLNLKFTSSSTKYTTFLNFPSTVLQMNLTLFFNIIAILLIIISITSEYRTGELRMIMIRAVSFKDIIKAKFLAIVSMLFLLLSSHLIISYILGYLFLPHEKVKFRTYNYAFTLNEAVLYNFKYYIIAFITLIAAAVVIMVICINCRTTTGAVGGSLTFIAASALYPTMYSVFTNKVSEIVDLSSLVSIQDHGILIILAQNPKDIGLIIFIIALYIGVFYLIAVNLFNDKDCYI